MTKYFEFQWRIPVPEALLAGAVCDRWTEVLIGTTHKKIGNWQLLNFDFFLRRRRRWT